MRKLLVTRKPIPIEIVHSGKKLLCFGGGGGSSIDSFEIRKRNYELGGGLPSGWSVWYADRKSGYIGRNDDYLTCWEPNDWSWMLEQVIILIKRLIGKKFTGAIEFNMHEGSISKKIKVTNYENL